MDETDRLKHLDDLGRSEDTRAYYDAWAGTYDRDLSASGYVAPERCAAALARFAPDRAAPLLDVACGTGVSGSALRAEGFTTIDGVDFAPEMLEKARAKGVYRTLTAADLGERWPFAQGSYPLIACVGAWSPGHLPAGLLDAMIGALPSEGLLVFTFSDRGRRDPAYAGRLVEQLDAGPVELLFREGGPYLPSEEINADVCVLRRR
jgi:predicted TPR repeat methyltransferase